MGGKRKSKSEFKIERQVKRWWSKYGQYIFNFEILGILIIVGLLVYFLVHRDRYSTYNFRGLEQQEIENAKGLPLHPSVKKKTTKNAPRWKHEEMCRQILEKIFNRPFKSIRPAFLKNPVTGQNLEIDCYNEELKLGLEYDGVQHSKYTPHFHRSGEAEFMYQLKKDQYKDAMCKKHGITLIRIPHFVHHTDLEKFITNKLRSAGKLP